MQRHTDSLNERLVSIFLKKTNDLFVKNNICITFAIGNKLITTV